MNNIKLLLRRYKNLTLHNQTVKEIVIKVIENLFKEEISEKDIKVQNQSIYINTSSNLKTTLFLEKEKVEKEIEKKLGNTKEFKLN